MTRSTEIINEINDNNGRLNYEFEATATQFFCNVEKGTYAKCDDNGYTFYKNEKSFAKALMMFENRGY